MKKSNRIENRELRSESDAQQAVDNRKILLGGASLFSLAVLALGVRSLFPDLNPYIVAGLGAALYVLYLGLALKAEMSVLDEESNELKTAKVPAQSSSEESL